MQEFSIAWILIAAALVLLAPGGALLAWAGLLSRARARPPDPLSMLADASALSLALLALAALVGFVLDIRFSGLAVVILLGACVSALLVGWMVGLPGPAGLRGWLAQRGLRLVGWLLSLLLLALLVGWRLYQARELALPPWVDSVHHTLAVRIILERGGIPVDLSPYIPATFTYHYGFHVAAALVAFGAGASPDQAVLWFGQALNALVGISVYRLASAILPLAILPPAMPPATAGEEAPTRPGVEYLRLLGRLIPAAAALLVTFGYQMPAYYLTWGRYTLLAGLILLGPAAAAALETRDAPDRRWPWVRLALLAAGLALTHYFALLLLALFCLVLTLSALFDPAYRAMRWKYLFRMAAAAAVGLALAAPWLVHVVQHNAGMTRVDVVNPFDASDAARKRADDYLRYFSFLTGPRRSHILLFAAGFGLLFALHAPRLRLLAAWGALLALFALPWGVRFQPFRPDYFAIILFFPAAPLLAWLLAQAVHWAGWGLEAAAVRLRRMRGSEDAAPARKPGMGGFAWAGVVVFCAVGLGLALWGARETRSIINPVTILATPEDLLALQWVNASLPREARFFINTTRWQGEAYRGVDGGYWLMPYTGRATQLPPIFYGWGAPQYVETISRWAAQSSAAKDCTPEFWQVVEEAGLTHVYVREGVGALQPAALAQCDRLQLLYQQAGVVIYAVQNRP